MQEPLESELRICSGFREIAEKYQGLILDQFGVLHNGEQALPGAPECVSFLYERGIKMIVLSNSPQAEESTLARLVRLGFDRTQFIGAVTAGGLARPHLQAGRFGRLCLAFTWEDQRGETYLLENGLEATRCLEAADFILAHGTQRILSGGQHGQDELLPKLYDTGDTCQVDGLLREASRLGKLMVCVNPDKVTVKSTGALKYVPGQLAGRYEELGGTVKYFGKPDPEGFRQCVAKLGLRPEDVAHVGDSLEHDVAGAVNAGLDVVFVASGIHQAQTGCPHGTSPEALQAQSQPLRAYLGKHTKLPTYVATAFCV